MTSINFNVFSRESLRNLFAFPSLSRLNALPPTSYRRVLVASALIFLFAVGVRLLHWHDVQTQIEIGKMHFGMADLYRADALKLLDGQYELFVCGPNPPENSEPMGHPPGYALW